MRSVGKRSVRPPPAPWRWPTRAIQARFTTAQLVLVVMPDGKHLTDVLEPRTLRGTKTFDGRRFAEVSGEGGCKLPDGRRAVALPQAKVDYVPSAPYGQGKMARKRGLPVRSNVGMTPRPAKVVELYASRKRGGGPWVSAYAASNQQEYFAESTTAYFGMNGARNGVSSSDWSMKHGPTPVRAPARAVLREARCERQAARPGHVAALRFA